MAQQTETERPPQNVPQNPAANQPQAVTLFDQFFPNGQTDAVTHFRYLCNPTTKVDATT